MPVRSSAARIATAPSSVAGSLARPPPSRPKGVRTAETMTERLTVFQRTVAPRARRAEHASAQERRVRAERPSVGGDEADRRLDIRELCHLARRVHVAERDREDAAGDSARGVEHVVGVAPRRPAGLERDGDPLLLGRREQRVADDRLTTAPRKTLGPLPRRASPHGGIPGASAAYVTSSTSATSGLSRSATARAPPWPVFSCAVTASATSHAGGFAASRQSASIPAKIPSRLSSAADDELCEQRRDRVH